MEKIIRETQMKLLKAFAGSAGTFALAGGTALELYYLKHRFSRDLDFFSPKYETKEIEIIINKFSKALGAPLKFENELVASNKAKVRFYSAPVKGSDTPLKIDFIEDAFIKTPAIINFEGVPVYSAKNIYFQKIIALVGSFLIIDELGREIPAGRKEVRDIVDLYYLSKKIEPLHTFLKTLDRQYQRGIIQWYRSYSRQDVKIGVLDLYLYDKNYDASEMIGYLDAEIKKFMEEEIK